MDFSQVGARTNTSQALCPLAAAGFSLVSTSGFIISTQEPGPLNQLLQFQIRWGCVVVGAATVLMVLIYRASVTHEKVSSNRLASRTFSIMGQCSSQAGHSQGCPTVPTKHLGQKLSTFFVQTNAFTSASTLSYLPRTVSIF